MYFDSEDARGPQILDAEIFTYSGLWKKTNENSILLRREIEKDIQGEGHLSDLFDRFDVGLIWYWIHGIYGFTWLYEITLLIIFLPFKMWSNYS